MDPYLEEPGIWPDFHTEFIVAIRAALTAVLPASLRASIDRYVWLHEPDSDERKRLGKPDAGITTSRPPASSPGPTALVERAPQTVVSSAIPIEGDRYIRIIDRQGRRVITVIELLSHANKSPSRDRDAYLLKRGEYLAAGASLVEIDLLRTGLRPPVGAPGLPDCDYCVMLHPQQERPRVGVWPMSIRDPLPTIPVPLDGDDPAVELPLQNCFDVAYRSGAYESEINYQVPPVPPFTAADAEWAADRIAATCL